ncbi:hypothetical protein BDZ89DRAFT_1069410 [Hymenopellis radicata]|nr:hypothetical protein BDZ89DRAFT_1069410 [Hymenopellis radicata]
MVSTLPSDVPIDKNAPPVCTPPPGDVSCSTRIRVHRRLPIAPVDADDFPNQLCPSLLADSLSASCLVDVVIPVFNNKMMFQKVGGVGRLILDGPDRQVSSETAA